MGIQSHNQNMITKPNIDQRIFSMIKIVLMKLTSVVWNVDKTIKFLSYKDKLEFLIP